jgi:phosphoribosylamine--glycine ligase
MKAVSFGERLPSDVNLSARGAAVATVIASPGYPEQPTTGGEIRLPAPREDVLVFHAGTGRSADGRLIATGGRVLTVTGLGADVEAAAGTSLSFADGVELEGKQLRRDIGWRELSRRAGAS